MIHISQHLYTKRLISQIVCLESPLWTLAHNKMLMSTALDTLRIVCALISPSSLAFLADIRTNHHLDTTKLWNISFAIVEKQNTSVSPVHKSTNYLTDILMLIFKHAQTQDVLRPGCRYPERRAGSLEIQTLKFISASTWNMIYDTAYHVARNLQCLQTTLSDITDLDLKITTLLYINNNDAIITTKSEHATSKSKHTYVKFHYLKEQLSARA